MHNAKVHDEGGPSMLCKKVGVLEVFNSAEDSENELKMTKKRTFIYFNNSLKNGDVAKTKEGDRLKTGQLVYYKGIRKEGLACFAIDVTYEPFWQWEHFDPTRGYFNKFLKCIIAGLIIIFGWYFLMHKYLDSEGCHFLINCEINWTGLVSVLFYVILIIFVVGYWSGSRTARGGFLVGLVLTILIIGTQLFDICILDQGLEFETRFRNLLIESMGLILTSTAIGGILERRITFKS